MDQRKIDFDLNSLQMICHLARSTSLADAAAKLSYGVTPARLGQRKAELEDQLGYAIFEPGKGHRLTEAGARLVRRAERCFRDLADEVYAGRDAHSPKLSIGGPGAFEKTYWARLLQKLRAGEPRIAPHIFGLDEDELLARLTTGRLQLVIIPLAHTLPAHFARERLVSLPLVLLVPRGSSIRRPEDLRHEKHLPYPVALPTTSTTLMALMTKNLRRLGLTLGPVTGCSFAGVLQLVAETGCLGLSLKHPALTAHPNVRALELSQWGQLDLGVVWHAPGTPLERRVVRLLQELAKEM
jgi:DNA-binding transcriptional LysR family regulator